MKTEEFWDKYMNEDILDIFDITCDFFSKELPKDFIEECDAGEVILEIIDSQVIAKNFDNALKFTALLSEKQPELYMEEFQYFDDFLVDYYCFKRDKQGIRFAFRNFLANPVKGIDMYLRAFKKLLFYQETEIIDEAASKNYQTIAENENLIGYPEHFLMIQKLYLILQEQYEKQNDVFDKNAITELLDKFNLDFDEEFLDNLDNGIFKPQKDASEINDLFQKDRENTFDIILCYFLRYMHGKGVAFYLSNFMGSRVIGFLKENKKAKKLNMNAFFKMNKTRFDEYLGNISGNFVFSNVSEVFAVLWSSVYFYEFLKDFGLIKHETFTSFLDDFNDLKRTCLEAFKNFLWNSNFVHSWPKPECISASDFEEEGALFRANFNEKPDGTYFTTKDILDLAGFGKDKNSEGNADSFIFDNTGEDELDERRDQDFNDVEKSDYQHIGIGESVRREKKTGRNAPCPCGSGKKYKKCCGKN
jgi:hypothetical protein